MAEAEHHPSVSVSLTYRDPKAALLWLERAFGLEPAMVILDAEDALLHSEMRFGDGRIMVGGAWSENHASPVDLGGKNTQSVHLHLTPDTGGDIDAHCERARAAGAEIWMEPETQFYGDRTYRARDIEGHVWTFGQTVQVMTPAQWDAALGGGARTVQRLP